MKRYVLTTILVILLSGIVFAQGTDITLLDSKYYYESSEFKTYYKSLISLDGTTYYREGHISFDDEGKTIQKLDKFKKDVDYTKIEDEDDDYVPLLKNPLSDPLFPLFKDYDGMAYIQFKNIEGNREHIKRVIARLDKEFILNNTAVSNYLDFDNGVGIAEYFTKNFDAAFQTIFSLLEREGMLDDILLGQRVYVADDDYNVEILYPIKYEGTFFGF